MGYLGENSKMRCRAVTSCFGISPLMYCCASPKTTNRLKQLYPHEGEVSPQIEGFRGKHEMRCHAVTSCFGISPFGAIIGDRRFRRSTLDSLEPYIQGSSKELSKALARGPPLPMDSYARAHTRRIAKIKRDAQGRPPGTPRSRWSWTHVMVPD